MAHLELFSFKGGKEGKKEKKKDGENEREFDREHQPVAVNKICRTAQLKILLSFCQSLLLLTGCYVRMSVQESPGFPGDGVY